MPGAPSSFLLLEVRPRAPRSVLVMLGPNPKHKGSVDIWEPLAHPRGGPQMSMMSGMSGAGGDWKIGANGNS